MAPRIPRAAIAAALALSVVGCKKSDSGDAFKESLAVLPKDANLFFGARMAELAESRIWKDHVAPELAEDEGYQELVEACGKDFLPEMASIVAAGSTESETVAIVFHGITRADVETCVENAPDDSEFTVSDEGELMVLTVPDGETTYAHWIDDDSALTVGPIDDSDETDEAARKQAFLDRIDADESLADNEEMMELIDGVDTSHSFYFAMNVQNMPDNPAPEKLQSAAGSVDISDGVAIDVRAGFTSAEFAAEFAEYANEAIGMAAMRPELKWIPDRVDVSVDGSFIAGEAELSEDDLRKLEELAESDQIPID